MDKKTNIFVEAKTVWSTATLASMVRLGRRGMLMRRARKANQVVAAGPKMTGDALAVCEWERRGVGGERLRGGGEREGGKTYSHHTLPSGPFAQSCVC